MGDVLYPYTAVLEMTGVPDTAPPSLGADRNDFDPLASLGFGASEPLPAGSAAELVGGGERVTLVPVSPEGTGVTTGFHREEPMALRYGISYQLGITPWVDLAGNAGGAPPRLTTRPPPPLVPEDGFESATGSVGGGMVIDDGSLPAIGGRRSVGLSAYGVLPPGAGSRFTVRLAVTPGDRVVRVALRPMGVYEIPPPFTGASTLRIAVPGGAITRAPLPGFERMTTRHPMPGGAGTIFLGEVRTVEIPLPAGVGAEIVFDMTLRPGSLCGPCAAAGGLLDRRPPRGMIGS